MPFHIKCAKDAILSYLAETGNTNALKGGNIFIQGSPMLEETKLIPMEDFPELLRTIFLGT